jgi:hypothetical protein
VPKRKDALHISPTLSLPLTSVTQTFGILAKRGAGKSNTGAVMAEEMFRVGLPFVVVDPVGAWWGLRSSRDGKSAGLPIPIFGGHRADVPLEVHGAELVADLVVDERLSCVLDVSAFDSEGSKRRFLASFAERLFRRKGQPGHDDPLHVFLEEADDYAPQRGGGVEINRTLGAFQRIVKQGRARGLGSTMITQRSAVLNKDLLTQIETLIVMRTTSPQDRKAIAGWVEYHAQEKEMLASLHELKDGEAWVWSPWLDLTKRIRINRRATFDSGATPTMAQRKAPATLADIDMDVLRERMAETIERTKENNPEELKRELARLREQVRNPMTERVEVPVEVVPNWLREIIGRVVVDMSGLYELLHEAEKRAADQRVEQGAETARSHAPAASRVNGLDKPSGSLPDPLPAKDWVAASLNGLGTGEARVLTAIALNPSIVAGVGATRAQVTILTGYKKDTRNEYIRRLVKAGLVEARGDVVVATQAGRKALGDAPSLPTGERLRAWWLDRLPKGEREVFSCVLASYPDGVAREDISAKTGYKKDTRNEYIRRLRVRQLVGVREPYVIAAKELYE